MSYLLSHKHNLNVYTWLRWISHRNCGILQHITVINIIPSSERWSFRKSLLPFHFLLLFLPFFQRISRTKKKKIAEEIHRQFQTFHSQHQKETMAWVTHNSRHSPTDEKRKHFSRFWDSITKNPYGSCRLPAQHSTFSRHKCTVIYLFTFLIVRIVLLMKFSKCNSWRSGNNGAGSWLRWQASV